MNLWPFRRSAPRPEVVLDDEALDRAIRAGVQFPLDWFLQQPPEIQETIAARRDLWLEDLALTLGYTTLDPVRMGLARAVQDGDEDAEAALVELNARTIAEQMGRQAARNGAGEAQPPPALTMAGIGKRRSDAAAKREAARRKGALFGAAEGKAS